MIRERPAPCGPAQRIAALAEATERYAEGLEDQDLANVYWGRSLGLWQALDILAVDRQSAGLGLGRRLWRLRCPGRDRLMDRYPRARPLGAPSAGSTRR